MYLEMGFWICVSLILYIYIGYMTIIFLVTRVYNRNPKKAYIEPNVSIIIAAFNEEKDIECTVLNKLSLNYPKDRLEIIVISDGSTDLTDNIVSNLAKRERGRIKFLRQEPRQGKTEALNKAVSLASGEILIFSDANSLYDKDAIGYLVSNFYDSTIGYVTGQMIYKKSDENDFDQGSNAYINYENLVRIFETRMNSVIGVDGGIDAVRRECYTPMRADQLPDFILPLNIVEQGKRVVYEPKAISYESALNVASDEYKMRVRVSLRAFWALKDKKNLLNPLRYPLFAWQLLSHKVLRYGAFFPLMGLFLLNIFLIENHILYAIFFTLQIMAYSLAAVGPLLVKLPVNHSKLLMPYYFAVLNIACAAALWKFINCQKVVLWKPRLGG
ncbi:MAG: glycosyltransferase family 2 protein [Candidatus Competibacteraceae bacterium]|nr:glycosyltransferase family 2 protein [Candidatus Competibacteraceae bacterium]